MKKLFLLRTGGPILLFKFVTITSEGAHPSPFLGRVGTSALDLELRASHLSDTGRVAHAFFDPLRP